MRSGWVSFTLEGTASAVLADLVSRLAVDGLDVLPAGLADLRATAATLLRAAAAAGFLFAGAMIFLSRTISFGDLSSRMPWNDACRMRSPWVQPWKLASTTRRGSTQRALRARVSSLGTAPNGGLSVRSGCSRCHRSRAILWV